MNRTLLYWTLITFILSCKPALKEVKNYEGDKLSEKYFVSSKTNQREGVYQKFFPNGKINIEAEFKNDTLVNTRKIYYENGQVEIEEHYLDGIFHGPYRTWYPNGKVNAVGNYLNGVMDGEWKRYFDTGELREKVTFADNEENGPFTEYYKNGNVQIEGTYAAGYENGELRKYNDQGELISKMNCVNGICETFWRSDDKKQEQ